MLVIYWQEPILILILRIFLDRKKGVFEVCILFYRFIKTFESDLFYSLLDLRNRRTIFGWTPSIKNYFQFGPMSLYEYVKDFLKLK